MKTKLFGLFLAAALTVSNAAGCQAAGSVASAGRAVEHGLVSADDALKGTADTTETGRTANPALTKEEAQNIALKHAGLSADQVTALHTEYEIERGIPQYDVEFHHGAWEYDYEIHADSGEILSFSRDD